MIKKCKIVENKSLNLKEKIRNKNKIKRKRIDNEKSLTRIVLPLLFDFIDSIIKII